jgi:hypothetical protein
MDLAFSLNDVAGAAPVERVRFMGNGNVGIGSTNPAYKLDVTNSITSRSAFNSPRFSSAGTYVYGVTNSSTWVIGNGSSTNNNATAPDGTTSAGTYTLSATSALQFDLFLTISGLTNGRVYTVGMWVKLGTATNFCLVVNNSQAWNTIGGKAFTSSDGLSTSKWTHISYTFAATASGAINLHLGYHLETGVTQQTAGTVFLWNIEMTEFSSTWIGNVEDEIRLPGSSIWTSRGNVGIGTTNPTATYGKLSVAGGIRILDDNNAKLEIGRYSSAFSNSYIKLGSNSNSLRITNNTDAADIFIIENGGNVGIGTVSPATLLSVGGAGSTAAASGITFGGDAQVNLYRIAEDILRTDANLNVLGYVNAGGYIYTSAYIQVAQGNIYPGGYTSDLNLNIGNIAANNWETAIKIKPGSYVGIGTTNPTGKLHVVSSVAGETVFRTDGTNGTLFSVVDDLSDSLMSVNNSAGLPVLEVFADDRIVAGQYGSGDFVLVNNKVGIGTSNPSYKLDVNGSLGINASTSDTNWPFVVSDNSSAGSRYGLNKAGSMGFNNADNYAQLQLVGINGAYLDLTTSIGGDSNARLIYINNRVDLTYGFIPKSTISLSSNGIGIGTTNPVWSLDVSGTAIRSFASGAVEPGFIVDYASSNGYGGLFIHTNGVRKWRIGNVGDTDASNPALFIWQEGVGARMYFRNNGYVGVGTTIVDNKLTVSVPSDSALGTSSDGLKITDGTRNVQLLRNGTGYNYAGVVGSGSMLYSYDRMYIVADTSNPILFHAGGAERVRIGSNGNVGIGVTNPTNTLQVNGQIAIKGDQSADNAKIYIQASDNSNRYTIETDLDANTANDLLVFRSNTVDNMLVLKGNGNVGIGTTNPVATLDIENPASNLPILNLGGGEAGNAVSDLYVLNSYNNNTGVGFAAKVIGVNISGSLTATNIPVQRTVWGGVTSATAIALGTDGPRAGAQDNAFQIWTTNDGVAGTQLTQKFSVSSAGNVGIGIVTPTDKIQISGGGISFTTSTGLAVPMLGMTPLNIAYVGPYNTPTDGNAPSTVLFNHGASVQQTWFYSSGSVAMVLNRQGRLHIGNNNNTPNCLLSVGPSSSTTAVSGMCFGNDAQANLYRSAEDTIKTDGNLVVAGTTSLNGHIYGQKTVTLSTASWTTVLTVNMLAHNSCYVKIGAFGDWSNHSAVAFVSELFIQNGDNAGYGEPGTIITAHDNTRGPAGDKIDIQIVDPVAAGTQNFLIQLKLISATSSTNSSLITYHVMGQQASVT